METTTFRMSLTEKEKEICEFLMKHHKTDRPQELFRALMRQDYNQKMQDQIRYGKSDRADKEQARKESITELKARFAGLSDRALTDELLRMGYLRKPELTDPELVSSERMRAEIIETDDVTGLRAFVQVHYDASMPDRILYRHTVLPTLDDIIRDMQKEKII
jgi:FKBP-type peptidyl-prolyl cis-trans isomerase (trigger factor)